MKLLKAGVKYVERSRAAVAVGLCAWTAWWVLSASAAAAPFGQGAFGADVPFGSLTSLSINLGGSVALALQPSGPTFSGAGSHTITVTSTDPAGYDLYVHTTTNSNLTNGSTTIPASNNATAGPLSINSWGYNTTGSTTNFLGMTNTNTLLKSATGPFKNGDSTTVTYGALTNSTQAAGTYTTSVTYTAVTKNE